ncbi:MAG: hypothetical protein EOO82_01765 [Oxalobacteraceae bacterium]|nr:MAG: hypothetical protein EOO82_01765 [Oxalobacteraceae bacterium]
MLSTPFQSPCLADRRHLDSRGGLVVAFALSLGLLGACSTSEHPKDAGQRLSDRGAAIGSYGTEWSDGQESVRKGEASLKDSTRSLDKAQRNLAKARAQVSQAEQRISDAASDKTAAAARIENGRAQMARAEAQYASTRAGPPAIEPK